MNYGPCNKRFEINCNWIAYQYLSWWRLCLDAFGALMLLLAPLISMQLLTQCTCWKTSCLLHRWAWACRVVSLLMLNWPIRNMKKVTCSQSQRAKTQQHVWCCDVTLEINSLLLIVCPLSLFDKWLQLKNVQLKFQFRSHMLYCS